MWEHEVSSIHCVLHFQFFGCISVVATSITIANIPLIILVPSNHIPSFIFLVLLFNCTWIVLFHLCTVSTQFQRFFCGICRNFILVVFLEWCWPANKMFIFEYFYLSDQANPWMIPPMVSSLVFLPFHTFVLLSLVCILLSILTVYHIYWPAQLNLVGIHNGYTQNNHLLLS